jgi:hypothetical protein
MTNTQAKHDVQFMIDRADTLQKVIEALPAIPVEVVTECYDTIKIDRWEVERAWTR